MDQLTFESIHEQNDDQLFMSFAGNIWNLQSTSNIDSDELISTTNEEITESSDEKSQKNLQQAKEDLMDVHSSSNESYERTSENDYFLDIQEEFEICDQEENIFPPRLAKKKITKQLKKKRIHPEDFRRPFSLKEDLMLVKLFQLYQFDWKAMLPYFPKIGKAAKLKNRYYSYSKNQKIFDALSMIIKDLEDISPIENYPEDILEPFQKFIPEIDRKNN